MMRLAGGEDEAQKLLRMLFSSSRALARKARLLCEAIELAVVE